MASVNLSKKAVTGIVVAVLVVLVLVVLGTTAFTTIPEGSMGVKYQLGKIVSADLDAGLQFKIPFVQDIQIVDMREQVIELDTTAYTKDTQTVESISLKLNYRLNQAELLSIAQSVGINNVEDKLIYPQVNTILKNAIGGFRAEDLIQNRQALQENVEKEMAAAMQDYGVIVTSLSLVNIDFDDTFEAAVRAKVVAEQDALRAKNKTLEVEEQSKQKVLLAQAEADSKRLIADSEAYSIKVIQEQLSSSPNYIEYEKIQQWNGVLPQVMGNEVNPFVVLGESAGSAGTTQTQTQTQTPDAQTPSGENEAE